MKQSKQKSNIIAFRNRHHKILLPYYYKGVTVLGVPYIINKSDIGPPYLLSHETLNRIKNLVTEHLACGSDGVTIGYN